jgi:glutamyl-tRNA synthetase
MQNMSDKTIDVRVRFAPSPTGALHIGGVRTALYNYLFARKMKGRFILRIEDTDQTRYQDGAEDYIIEALHWLGLSPDEGPHNGGAYGPYRQSDRSEIYLEHAQRLVENGKAYYAFDTPEELENMRERLQSEGVHSPKYDARVRMQMKNSLTMTEAEVKELLNSGAPHVIRIKVPEDEVISFKDEIRDVVRFEGRELDDKVLIKTDGLPTYHLANVVDDYAMDISHVIRGEEWLSSTAHHVLLYRAFGWADDMPVFAHLPLILKPGGKGKLSKRDGKKLGIPVFPLSWPALDGELEGFREVGFLPEAVINFLAFMGWNPGTEKELFSIDELCDAFSLAQVGKSGARFDFEKALWFNQQHIIMAEPAELAPQVGAILSDSGYDVEGERLEEFIALFQERVMTLREFWIKGYYAFRDVTVFDEKMVRKKWKGDGKAQFNVFIQLVEDMDSFDREALADAIKAKAKEMDLGLGKILPLFRLAICGTMQGPDLFSMMAFLGKKVVVDRMQSAPIIFNEIKG